MKHLGELNTSRFFCPCGLGPADNCPAHHVEQPAKPGNPLRHVAILSGIFVIAIIVMLYGFAMAM
jgi:hypothetical protein